MDGLLIRFIVMIHIRARFPQHAGHAALVKRRGIRLVRFMPQPFCDGLKGRKADAHILRHCLKCRPLIRSRKNRFVFIQRKKPLKQNLFRRILREQDGFIRILAPLVQSRVEESGFRFANRPPARQRRHVRIRRTQRRSGELCRTDGASDPVVKERPVFQFRTVRCLRR